MGTVEQTAVHLVKESGGWRRWLFSFFLVGASIAATVFIATSFFTGDSLWERLETAYRLLWQNTTQRQFTEIMRENPWLLVVPGVTIIFVSGLLLPLGYWSRAAYVYLAFGIGVLVGHVFF